MDLKELEQGVDPKVHWYYQSKKLPLIRFVKKVFNEQKHKLTLVDIGSGSGFFMYELFEMVPEMIEKIYLVDIGYTDAELNETKGKIIEKLRLLPSRIEHGLFVMMDVLEHLEDDTAMLNEVKKCGAGVNHFFVTVPAFKDLWSGHDVWLGHYRRYTKSTLDALLSRANFGQRNVYYLFATIFPLVWTVRKWGNKTYKPKTSLKPANPFVNSLLRGYNSFEMNFSRMNKLFGVTCTAEGKI